MVLEEYELHFMDKLWEAASRLRGKMEVSQYKHIVLPLIFLKYISDMFESRRKRLEKAIRVYHNRAITSAQVMEEPIIIAREISESETEKEKLCLTEEELAFYVSLARGKEHILSDEQFKKFAKKLVDAIGKNLSTYWTKHESINAKIRVAVKRILRTYGISPIKHPNAIELIMKQAQALYKDWPSGQQTLLQKQYLILILYSHMSIMRGWCYEK
ncbi:MAG TPA: type I restriction enzyme endonuclease domain-containing protein [bacterium]|nr:type I restriction enzyme endonuclease domain-containing protein [bacterium]